MQNDAKSNGSLHTARHNAADIEDIIKHGDGELAHLTRFRSIEECQGGHKEQNAPRDGMDDSEQIRDFTPGHFCKPGNDASAGHNRRGRKRYGWDPLVTS